MNDQRFFPTRVFLMDGPEAIIAGLKAFQGVFGPALLFGVLGIVHLHVDGQITLWKRRLRLGGKERKGVNPDAADRQKEERTHG